MGRRIHNKYEGLRGSAVIISNECPKYDRSLSGLRGIVVDCYGDDCGVRVAGKYNPGSSSGLFWIPGEYLEKESVKTKFSVGQDVVVNEKSCFYSTLRDVHGKVVSFRFDFNLRINIYGVKFDDRREIFWVYEDSLDEGFRGPVVVKVKYLDETISSRGINYRAYENYEVGDYVMVKSGHHGIICGVVVEKDVTTGKVNFDREIICKVDMSKFNERNDVRSKKENRKAEILQSMEKIASEFNKFRLYEILSNYDKSLKEMYNEYSELAGISSVKNVSDKNLYVEVMTKGEVLTEVSFNEESETLLGLPVTNKIKVCTTKYMGRIFYYKVKNGLVVEFKELTV